MGAGQCGFAHQHPGRPLFTVRIGYVQSHSTGAGSADFKIESGVVLHHCGMEYLHMTDDLRDILGCQYLVDLRQETIGEFLLPGCIG